MNPKTIAESAFTCVYVLTTSGRDDYVVMALISMISLKISNPHLRILLLCDTESYRNLRSNPHPIISACDEFIEVDTPTGSATFRNRWIKTKLYHLVPGNVLYLDSDTIIRGPLADLPSLVSGFGAVANHNAETNEGQILKDDRAESIMHGWGCDYKTFVNGGVWFYRRCDSVERFFTLWHDLWLRGIARSGRLLDQPSLNRAVIDSGVFLTVLPALYNAQVCGCWKNAKDALVWHFYASGSNPDSAYAQILAFARRNRGPALTRQVRNVAAMPAPWPNIGILARWLATCLPPESRELSIRALLKSGHWFKALGLIWLQRKWRRSRSPLAQNG